MYTVDKNHIIGCLKELGIQESDMVMMHSSLSAIGEVDGGAATVIDAFFDVLGPGGTLVMPAFGNMTQHFDVSSTPSEVGIITEVFRKRKNVLRSLHPTHSVCAAGKNAAYITEGHNLSPTACGRSAPFYKMLELKGKVMLLGVDMNRNTILHAVEEEAEAPYLIETVDVPAPTYIENYKCRSTEVRKFPAGHRDFLKLTPFLRRVNMLKEAFIGQASVKVMNVGDLFGYVLEILKSDPGFFLCNNKYCNSCVAAKGKIDKTKAYTPIINNKCGIDNCEVCVI